MDFDTLLARVRGILFKPTAEWQTIAGESDTPSGIYKRYILILAALPPVFHFIKFSLIGEHTLGMVLRDPFIGGLWDMVLGYLGSLIMVFVMAQIIQALAPSFEGQKNPMQALKVVAYAWTAYWVASIALVLPWLGWLIVLAGAAYSVYLLFLGLPQTMRCPPERSLGYTAVSALLAILLGWLLGLLLGTVSTSHTLSGHVATRAKTPTSAGPATSRSATQAAAATVPAAAVQSLSPERMRAMLPEKLDGYTRASARASRQNVMNMPLSQAEGIYRGKDANQIDLTILDAAGARHLLGMGEAPSGDAETVTDNGFDKIIHDGDRLIHETWNSKTHHGEYTVTVGQRFSVRASGTVDAFDTLKDAARAVDLDALEKLAGSGH